MFQNADHGRTTAMFGDSCASPGAGLEHKGSTRCLTAKFREETHADPGALDIQM